MVSIQKTGKLRILHQWRAQSLSTRRNQMTKKNSGLKNFANQKWLSTQNYLVKMIHHVLTATDRNSQQEAKAVIMQMIDWDATFDR